MALPSVVATVLPALQWAIIIALIFVTGTAWCFILWIIPIVKLNPSGSAIRQLEETSLRGGRWLEPFNAFLAATLAVTAILLSRHPDPAQVADWKYYAAASATLVQVAWWERLLIFPLDRAATAMKQGNRHLKVLNSESLDEKSLIELHRLMNKWAIYHAGRASLPFAAAMIAFYAKMRVGLT